MIERVLERGLQAELIGHLGYAKHEPAGGGNARNGTTPKTVAFEPRLVPKVSVVPAAGR
jgi:putative transposase